MNVLLVTDFAAPRGGGIEVQVHGLAGALAAAGHDVRIATTTPGPATVGGQRITRLPRRWSNQPWWPDGHSVRALGRLLDDDPPDVVHAHASVVSPLAWAAIRCAADRRLPRVASFHSLPGVAALAWKAMASRAPWDGAVVAAVSQAVADQLSTWTSSPVVILPNSITLPSGQRTEPPGPFHVVVLGRLVPRKRPWAAVRVLRSLRRRLDGPLRVTFIGDGPLRRPTRWALAAAGLDDAHITGWLPGTEAHRVLEEGHVLLHTATKEALGLALLEALGRGIPVVARASGGPASLLAGGAGSLSDDEPAMVHALSALACDPEQRHQLGQSGRDCASRFDWDAGLQQHLEVYRQAIRLVQRPPAEVRA